MLSDFKALLVGIRTYSDARLEAPINDVNEVKSLLVDRYGARSKQMKILTNSKATRAAILDGIAWLAEGSGEGSTRLFYYSGHGTQYADEEGGDSEPDFWDECLVPIDRKGAKNLLKDDTLAEAYKAVHSKAHFLLVMDCCNAGTIQKDDASKTHYKFTPPSKRQLAKVAKRASAAAEAGMTRKKGKKAKDIDASAGSLVLLSASLDGQDAAERPFDDGKYHSALTYYLVRALRDGPLTYDALEDTLQKQIEKAKFSQRPGLTCTKAKRQLLFLNTE